MGDSNFVHESLETETLEDERMWLLGKLEQLLFWNQVKEVVPVSFLLTLIKRVCEIQTLPEMGSAYRETKKAHQETLGMEEYTLKDAD